MYRMKPRYFHDSSALEFSTFSYLLETLSVVSRTMVTAVLAIAEYQVNCTEDLLLLWGISTLHISHSQA